MAGKKIVKKTVKTVNDVSEKTFEELLFENAVGYKTEDIVEEYAMVDGELLLQKKKVNIKSHPPDLNLLKYLIEKQKTSEDFEDLSVEELEKKYESLCLELKKELEREVKNGDQKTTT